MGWMTTVSFLAGNIIFSLCHHMQTSSGAYPASYAMGSRNSFPRVKQPEYEAYHSPLPSAKVKDT